MLVIIVAEVQFVRLGEQICSFARAKIIEEGSKDGWGSSVVLDVLVAYPRIYMYVIAMGDLTISVPFNSVDHAIISD